MSNLERDQFARQARFLAVQDPEAVFLGDLLQLIRRAHARGGSRRARDGVLRVLLLGYVGAGNTGADVRAIEVIRQLRRNFAGRPLKLTLFNLGNLLDHPVFEDVARLTPSTPYLPDALDAALPHFDMVLNVEGSTYTSRFSDTLAGSLIGGIALAHAHGALACAYGVDAGAMSPQLTAFATSCANAAPDALIFCRSAAAFAQLTAQGLAPRQGADAAWRYRLPRELTETGPDPSLRYAALCPNNPYCWPVVTDVRRAIAGNTGNSNGTGPAQHGPLTFYSWDNTRAQNFERYASSFAALADELRQRGIEPVLVAMESSDLTTCEEIAAHAHTRPRIVARPDASIDLLIHTLSRSCCVVTTRYHAALFAMAHGVPVFGVSMDERIKQLFDDARLHGCLTAADDPIFAKRALEWLERCALPASNGLKQAYKTLAARQISALEAMDKTLRDALDAHEAACR